MIDSGTQHEAEPAQRVQVKIAQLALAAQAANHRQHHGQPARRRDELQPDDRAELAEIREMLLARIMLEVGVGDERADRVEDHGRVGPPGARFPWRLYRIWHSTIPASELGLWQATDGTLKALINVGPTNPKEFSEVTSTTDTLKPLAQATGGDARRIVDGSSIDLPRIVPVRASGVFHGDGWMGVRMRDASVVKGVGVLPVFAGLIGLLLLLGAFAATWLREGR